MGSIRPHAARIQQRRLAPLVRQFGPFLREIRQVTKRLDVQTPDSSVGRIEKFYDSIQGRLDALSPESVEEFSNQIVVQLLEIMGDPSMREGIIATHEKLAKSSRHRFERMRIGRLLLQLAAEADARVPFASFAIAVEAQNGVPLGDPVTASIGRSQIPFLRDLMAASAAYQDIHGLRGEKRCGKVMILCGAVIEPYYNRYLRLADAFLQVILDKPPLSQKLSFGQLALNVRERLPASLEDLVDPDVAFRRNVSCHASWRYIPEQNAIELRDKGKPARTLAVAEVEAAAEKVLATARVALSDFLDFQVQAAFSRREFIEPVLVSTHAAIRANMTGEDMAPAYTASPMDDLIRPYLEWKRRRAT